MKSLFLIFYIYFIFLINNAHAYLDPGTGSIILQALLGAIAATASYISETGFQKIIKSSGTFNNTTNWVISAGYTADAEI